MVATAGAKSQEQVTWITVMETGMQLSQIVVAKLTNVYTFMLVMDGLMMLVLLQKVTLFANQLQRRFIYLLLLLQEILVKLSVKLLATMV